MNLKEWRKSRAWRQEDLAEKLDEIRATYQSWESGRSAIPPAIQVKLRKLGYAGSWPREETRETASSQGDFVSREDFWKAVGRIERLESAFEKLAEAIRALDIRTEELHPRGRSG